MITQRHELRLVAEYYQFYLQDETAEGDLSDAWTPEAADRLLALAPGTIGVGTYRNADVPVLVEVHDREPVEEAAAWDRVNESTLDVPSGRIVIAGCTDYFPDAARIQVPSGRYRARVCYAGKSSLSADGFDGDDRYRVALWPAPESRE